MALISFFCGQIASFSSTMVEQASIPMPVFDDFVRNLGTIAMWVLFLGPLLSIGLHLFLFQYMTVFVTMVLYCYLKTDIVVLPEVFCLLGIALARLLHASILIAELFCF